MSWGPQAVFGVLFRGCIVHLPLVMSARHLCWSSIVHQWLEWRCDGLDREITMVSHAGTPATTTNTHPPENCKGKLKFQGTTLTPSWTALQWWRQAWPPACFGMQAGTERRMGPHLRGKTFLWHFCCYYYLNQLILISVNVTESLYEQKTNPLVMFAELILFWHFFLFLPHALIHMLA